MKIELKDFGDFMMECVRCGQCCISVGREFWLHGDFKGFPALAALSKKHEDRDDGLPCRMLQMKDGVASCKIELIFGRSAKPKVCRDYPVLDCRYEVNEINDTNGRAVCYLQSG